MDQQQPMQIGDLMGVARRRGRAIVAIAGVVILAVYWLTMALPNRYSASATILVEPQTIDEQLVRAGVREADLNERLGIMTAQILRRARLSKLIDDLGLYPEESKHMVRQEVVDLMRADVSIEPVLNELEAEQRNRREIEFNTFKITYTSDDAAIAANVANSIANDFIDANIKARVEVSQQSLDFMGESISSLRNRLQATQAQIKTIKAENPGSLPEELESNQRILQVTLAALAQAEREMDVAESDLAFWKNQVIAAVTLTSPNDVTSPAFRLKVAENEHAQLLAMGYTDKHPDVVRVRAEIKILRDRIANDASGEGSVGSYAEQNARSEERRAALRKEAAASEVERLKSQIEEIQRRIAATPAVAEKLEALKSDYDHLSVSFQDFSGRQQQALVQANLERKQLGEQFRILEAAYPAVRPSSPKRPVLLLLGVLLGCGIGIAAGLVLEGSDSSLHESRDLQVVTAIPVLAAVPVIMTEWDRAMRTRMLIRQGVAAGFVLVLFILGGVLTYVYVNGAPGFMSSGDEKVEAPAVQEPSGPAARRTVDSDGGRL